jgi:hypothetical protein
MKMMDTIFVEYTRGMHIIFHGRKDKRGPIQCLSAEQSLNVPHRTVNIQLIKTHDSHTSKREVFGRMLFMYYLI